MGTNPQFPVDLFTFIKLRKLRVLCSEKKKKMDKFSYLKKIFINPLMHNLVKWPNILLKSCGMGYPIAPISSFPLSSFPLKPDDCSELPRF